MSERCAIRGIDGRHKVSAGVVEAHHSVVATHWIEGASAPSIVACWVVLAGCRAAVAARASKVWTDSITH